MFGGEEDQGSSDEGNEQSNESGFIPEIIEKEGKYPDKHKRD